MSRHPTQGVAGSKPRLERKSARAENSRLSAEYLRLRNEKLQAQAFLAKTLAAEKHGELVPFKEVKMRSAWLLTGLRQQLLLFSHSLPRKLVGLGEHEMGIKIGEEVRNPLVDTVNWPARFADDER